MVIYNKAVIAGYIKDLWFENNAITNIFSLKNVIHQYRVTYDSLDQMFIFHRKENNNLNMHFRIHESGLHYYDPAEDSTFVTTVVDNKKHYRKRHIKEAERSAYIYGNVTYPAVVDCRLYTQSNQIKE